MKELSIGQKAKAYDEAIGKLRGMMPNWKRLSYNGKTFLQDLVYIFPELKESKDEEIRGAIIDYLKDHNLTEWAAWLEKQGEKGINGKNREIPFSEQKPAWSEEDEKYLIYNIEQDYRNKLNNNPPESLRHYYNKVISWLKSLRPQKVQKVSKEDLEKMGKQIAEYNKLLEQLRPQNAWKPSEEQIIDLEKAIDDFIPSSYKEIRVSLEKLLKQLKAL